MMQQNSSAVVGEYRVQMVGVLLVKRHETKQQWVSIKYRW